MRAARWCRPPIARFKEGDPVICTSYDLGVAHDGGYAEYVRVPADWVVPLPKGLTSVRGHGARHRRLYRGARGGAHGARWPQARNGPVIVTGATGGVGSVAIDILAGAGYHVVALTGKEAETRLSEAPRREGSDAAQQPRSCKIKPLDKATWAGAVDNLGGDVLAWLASTMQVGGTLASIGLAASHTLNTTVMPFILRGVSLLGVDSVNTPMPLRQKVWQRLASDLKPQASGDMCHDRALEDLPGVFEKILKAQMRGRTVVKLAG